MLARMMSLGLQSRPHLFGCYLDLSRGRVCSALSVASRQIVHWYIVRPALGRLSDPFAAMSCSRPSASTWLMVSWSAAGLSSSFDGCQTVWLALLGCFLGRLSTNTWVGHSYSFSFFLPHSLFTVVKHSGDTHILFPFSFLIFFS